MASSFLIHEIAGTLLISVIAVSVLVLADVLKRTTTLPYEITRKVAHIGSGLAVLLIPAVIDSSWTVLILAMSFAGLMLSTHLLGLLQGVHGVQRGVGGVLWYPTTAWLTFFIVFDVRDGVYLDFAIPVLVLACADAVGAVVGKRWGRHHYEVIEGHFRSIEGSFAFFVVALMCICIPLIGGLGVDPMRALVVGVLVALLATMCESVSVHGLDNVLVPVGTLLFLDHYLTFSWAEIGIQALLIVGICLTAGAVRHRRPATGGGFAAFFLSAYTVLVLGGWTWLPPLVGLIAAYVAYERLTPLDSQARKSRYEMGTSLVGLAIPVLLVLAHAVAPDAGVQRAIFIGYVASIACQGSVLCYLLPQHRSFRLSRLRRLLAVRDPWQMRPNVGKLVLASLGAAVTAMPLVFASRSDAVSGAELAVIAATCGAGLMTFITLSGAQAARRSCNACGNVTLHGLACCHDLELGTGDALALRTLTFRTTYVTATTVSAAVASVVVLAWMT